MFEVEDERCVDTDERKCSFIPPWVIDPTGGDRGVHPLLAAEFERGVDSRGRRHLLHAWAEIMRGDIWRGRFSWWLEQNRFPAAVEALGLTPTQEDIQRNAFLRSDMDPMGTAVRHVLYCQREDLDAWVYAQFVCAPCEWIEAAAGKNDVTWRRPGKAVWPSEMEAAWQERKKEIGA